MKLNGKMWVALLSGLLLTGCGKQTDHSSHGTPGLETGKKDTPAAVTAPAPAAEARILHWTCSMHPQVKESKAGDCPFCGMALVPVKEKVAEAHAPSASGEVVTLDAAQNGVISVQTKEAGPWCLEKEVRIFGEITYVQDRHLDFTWYFGGRIDEILISYNTTEVKTGQPLMRLYSEELIAEQERYLEALRERWLATFYERKVITAKIEAIKTRLRKAGFTEDDFERLVNEKKIRETVVIPATHSGSIVGPLPHVGERLTPESIAFHIVPLDKVWFTGRVFEQDLSAISLGGEVKIETKARPGQVYPGKVVFIDRVINSENRTVQIRVAVENPRKELLPGMSAAGAFTMPVEHLEVAVPESAIIDTGLRKVVYVEQKPGSYEMREVKTGLRTDQQVQITEGLKVGESVVIQGAFLIDAEAQIRGQGASSHKH